MTYRDEAIKEASMADCVDPDCDAPCGSCSATANGVIAAYEKALEARGFKIVSVKPSEKMIDAGMFATDDSGHPEDVWSCMIAHAHGPQDVGNVVTTLKCSECDATTDLIETEPDQASLNGVEGWSIIGDKKLCPQHSRASAQ